MGFPGFPKLTEANGNSSLPPYLRIASDGGIHLGVPSSEMGQGIHTTLAMLVAEELEVEMEQIQHIETLQSEVPGCFLHVDCKSAFQVQSRGGW